MTEKISTTPSKAIHQAVTDLEQVEARDDFEVEMGDWYQPITTNYATDICTVCFGGATMARVLDWSPTESIYIPEDLVKNQLCSDEEKNMIVALEYIRRPNDESVKRGLRDMGVFFPVQGEVVQSVLRAYGRVTFSMYWDDAVQFKHQRLTLADKLAEKGY